MCFGLVGTLETLFLIDTRMSAHLLLTPPNVILRTELFAIKLLNKDHLSCASDTIEKMSISKTNNENVDAPSLCSLFQESFFVAKLLCY